MKKRRTKPTLRAMRNETRNLMRRVDRDMRRFQRQDDNKIAQFKRRNPHMHVVVVRDVYCTGLTERVEWLQEHVSQGNWCPLTREAIAFSNLNDAIHFKLRFVG